MSHGPSHRHGTVLPVEAYEPPLVATILARAKAPAAPRAHAADASPPPGWKRDLWLEGCELRLGIRPGLVIGEEGGSLVIRDKVTGDRHNLNRSAAAIFLLINGSREMKAVSDALSLALSVDRRRLEADLHRVVCEMVMRGILVVRRKPAAA